MISASERSALGILRAVALLAAAVGLISCDRPDTASPKPNIVLVIIDTLRADRLNCYGYDRPTSPELDEYARRGVRFANVVSQSSWTRPSIGSFLTSLYPRTVGIENERVGILNDRFTTLAEVLEGNGYRTLGATANPHLNRSFNFQQGFDHYLDTLAVWHWMDDSRGQLPSGVPPLPSAMEMFEKIVEMLDEESGAERAAPHYLQFSLMEVHEDYGKNDLVRDEFKRFFIDVEYERGRRYLQAIRQVSHDIDWLVRALTALPGWEDTLFIFVSDHGEGLDSHPSVDLSFTHGYLLYESHMMVPWILYSASGDLPEGLVIERPVRLLDLMPTVLDLVGIRLPDAMSGVSLAPLIRDDGEASLPEHFVVETRYQLADKMGIYANGWKYFDNRDSHRGLNRHALHRLGVAEDGANTDVASEHPEIVRRLADSLELWEQRNPRSPATLRGQDLSETELEHLRSLGYIH